MPRNMEMSSAIERNDRMEKVIIIGCPGSGKSTFGRELTRVTGLPLYHLDMMYWNEDRTTVTRENFIEKLQAVMSKKEWILDGNYESTMEMRFKECDTVFFLDYPTDLCIKGIEERKGKPRSDMPWIEDDTTDDEFISFIKNYNTESRIKVIALIKKYPDKEVFIFNSREESNRFIKALI